MGFLRSTSDAEKRVRLIEKPLRDIVDQEWPPAFLATGHFESTYYLGPMETRARAKPIAAKCLNRLMSSITGVNLDVAVADMFFSPALWQPRYEHDFRGGAIVHVLREFLETRPPADILNRLQMRTEHMLRNPCGDGKEEREIYNIDDPEAYYTPTLGDCLDLLLHLPVDAPLLDYVQSIVDGSFDFQCISTACWHPHDAISPRLCEILFSIRSPTQVPRGWLPTDQTARAYEIRQRTLTFCFPALLDLLFRNRRLDDDLLLTAFRHTPKLIFEAGRDFTPYGVSSHYNRRLDPAFVAKGAALAQEVAEKACSEFRPGDAAIITRLERLRGSQFLLHAARLHSQNGLGKLKYRGTTKFIPSEVHAGAWISTKRDDIEAVVVHLLQTRLPCLTNKDREELLTKLREYPKKTLENLMPLAHHSRAIICDALGWNRAIPLVDAIVEASRLDEELGVFPTETRSSPDPSYGALNAHIARSALAQAGDNLARQILKMFRQSGLAIGPTLMLFEAVAGWDPKAVEERIAKRNQPALRAFGLLPITRGEEEIAERYSFLKRFEKESDQFGMLRQGNEKSAVQAALENLASNAGYSDATRLEWAMEARLGASNAPGKAWAIAGYQVELVLQGRDVSAQVSKDGKQLKSPPESLRRSQQYGDVKEALKRLRTEISRFRTSLENIMAIGDSLERKELESIFARPTAKELISGLVWRTESDHFGMIDSDRHDFVLIDGTRMPIPEKVTLAHPFGLFGAGQLTAWQREIVHRKMEQPFKQVFRELYLLTPAELETKTYSNRFAGRLLTSKVAGRLLQARGWKTDPGEVPLPHKIFPKHGLRANFDFPDAGHILAETETITSDRIFFWHHPLSPGKWPSDEEWVPLAEIPPILFSEVMRDADLVVSVAQSGEVVVSDEAYQRRGEIVKTVIDDLGIEGVAIDKHHALVKGKLSNYKVHLWTAHIFVEPGSYLCVVPDRWGKSHEKLFLPFADEGDQKLSEVISKILLLVNDDKIRDESILKQIRKGGLNLTLHRA